MVKAVSIVLFLTGVLSTIGAVLFWREVWPPALPLGVAVGLGCGGFAAYVDYAWQWTTARERVTLLEEDSEEARHCPKSEAELVLVDSVGKRRKKKKKRINNDEAASKTASDRATQRREQAIKRRDRRRAGRARRSP